MVRNAHEWILFCRNSIPLDCIPSGKPYCDTPTPDSGTVVLVQEATRVSRRPQHDGQQQRQNHIQSQHHHRGDRFELMVTLIGYCQIRSVGHLGGGRRDRGLGLGPSGGLHACQHDFPALRLHLRCRAEPAALVHPVSLAHAVPGALLAPARCPCSLGSPDSAPHNLDTTIPHFQFGIATFYLLSISHFFYIVSMLNPYSSNHPDLGFFTVAQQDFNPLLSVHQMVKLWYKAPISR